MKNQMKKYPKTFENIGSSKKCFIKYVKAKDFSVDELVARFKSLYFKTNKELFSQAVNQLWLDKQILIKGNTKSSCGYNGMFIDSAYAKFMHNSVGTSHRIITSTPMFTSTVSYIDEFFPDFLKDDPSKNPKKYAYPYKHITLDFLFFVHEVDNRLELLAEAEKKKMSLSDFIDFSVNWALCYNLDYDVDKYEVYEDKNRLRLIKNRDKISKQQPKADINVKKDKK
jgi:hypothetical protein